MTKLLMKVGVAGSGAMGSGIAQVAAMAGHPVVLLDSNASALDKARQSLQNSLAKLCEKNKLSQGADVEIMGRISFSSDLSAFSGCGLVIEAVVEKLEVKQDLFSGIEQFLSPEAILATNTSSLSVVSIGAKCKKRDRVIGIHFFNPAAIMPLVEVVPAFVTDPSVVVQCRDLIASWVSCPL